ncbi:MAG: MotA/TolQ/ExbB proton channel family protein [Hyphomicrobiales bacterium]|nr:MotA/TolQ/ExbB proton channel family protein [Hyphomicrobiales bacterium]
MVKAVMLLLVAASIACWALIADAAVQIRRLQLSLANASGVKKPSGLLDDIMRAGEQAAIGSGNLSGEQRIMAIETAMRHALAQSLENADRSLPVLGIITTAAPFIGLFGTVWGIMHAFGAIAVAKDTSLAVVAPGIAEALLATALGLAAAIPAAIAHMRFAGQLSRLNKRGLRLVEQAAFSLIAIGHLSHIGRKAS